MPKKTEVNTVFMAIMTTILIAGIPWAMSVHGRLARIETTLTIIHNIQDGHGPVTLGE